MQRQWIPVTSKKSGCLWKNGCVLTMGSYYDKSDFEVGCLVSVKHSFKESDIGMRNGWMVEKDGYIIGADNFQTNILTALNESDYAQQASVIQLIEQLNSFAEMSYTETLDKRMNHQTKYVKKAANVLSESDKQLRDTALFKCVREISTLKRGYYRIISANDTIVHFVNLLQKEDGEVEITAEPYALKSDIFQKLFKLKVFCVADFIPMQINAPVDVVCKISEYPSFRIPDIFYDLGLDNEQLGVLSYAAASAVNVIPLLNKQTRVSYEFINALKRPCKGLAKLYNAAITKESESAVAQVVMAGLNLNNFVTTSNFDREMLLMQLEDFNAEYQYFLDDLGAQVYNSDQAKQMYSYRLLGKEAYESAEGFLKFDCEYYGMSDLAEQLIGNGIVESEVYKMSLCNVTDTQKLYAYFAIPGAEYCKGIYWNDLLKCLLDEAQYVAWSAALGLHIYTRFGRIGRDDNGIILYYNEDTPRFRSVTIETNDNRQTFFYGEELINSYVHDWICTILSQQVSNNTEVS